MNHAVMEYLQDKRINLGFSIIYTSERQASLPENIRTVCIIKDSDRGVLLLNEGRRVNREFEIQHTKGADLERSARDLSALIHEKGISSRHRLTTVTIIKATVMSVFFFIDTNISVSSLLLCLI